MDKNTIIGLVLIVAIFLGFNWLTKPSEEQIAAQKHYNDSVRMAQAAEQLFETEQQKINAVEEEKVDNEAVKSARYGTFANAANGDTTLVEIETELLKLQFSPQGGFLYSAELKKYRTHDSLPLVIFNGKEENSLKFTFLLEQEAKFLTSDELFFTPQEIIETEDAKLLTMRLQVQDSAYIDFIYTIKNDSYKIDFDIVAKNMSNYFSPMTSDLDFVWSNKIRQQEKGRNFENKYTTLNYRFASSDMEKLSETKKDEKNAQTPLQWVASKGQFFSTVILAKQNFQTAKLTSTLEAENSIYLKKYSVESSIKFDPTGQQPTNLQIFLLPNHYKTLASFNKNTVKEEQPKLQNLIPLGWSLFSWVSHILIIPMFNFFGSFLTNFGLIILLMTIVIKVIILPFTFKSYMSTAKMRVLKPQIDAINERIPADKMMERQQATMALYKSVGVSPMGGCLPMLFQMPILIAMFWFFPSAIELRQQSFLWAADLSTYDTVPFLTWNANIPFFGNHLSLFCILMTITNIVYTKLNMTSMGGQQQMAMMKYMMYLMPLMFLFIFNDYPSGLSYYYLVSTLITIGQTYLFRLFVDEDKLLKKLELAKANKKASKKSGFMARLEAAQKEQQKRLREQAKKGKR